MPHSNNNAAAPVVIAAATLVPVNVVYPILFMPNTFTAGDVIYGFNWYSLVGPLPELAYKLPVLSSYPPVVKATLAVPGDVTVKLGSGVKNDVSSLINPVIGSHACIMPVFIMSPYIFIFHIPGVGVLNFINVNWSELWSTGIKYLISTVVFPSAKFISW